MLTFSPTLTVERAMLKQARASDLPSYLSVFHGSEGNNKEQTVVTPSIAQPPPTPPLLVIWGEQRVVVRRQLSYVVRIIYGITRYPAVAYHQCVGCCRRNQEYSSHGGLENSVLLSQGHHPRLRQ